MKGKHPSEFPVAYDLWRAQRQGEAGLAARRERRFAELVRYAREHSPFYQNLYKDLPADNVALRDLPPVTKRQLMASFDDWVTDRNITRADVEAFVADPEKFGTLYRGEIFACTSSGTTGYPGLFLHDPHALAVYRAIVLVRIDLAWMGIRDYLRLAWRGLRWAALLGTGGHFAGAGWVELERHSSRWKSKHYRVCSVQRPIEELVRELNAFDPTIIAAYPSALELLAEEQAAGRMHIRPILVEIAGESATSDATARMEAALGCKIRNTYGASEFTFFAMSCDHGWLHVCSDWIIVEPVNEDFSPTPAGEPSHTVLITNLANRVQPIIRYDLGDSVVARPDPCPCGSHLPAIRVAGRCDDVLHLQSGDGQIVKVLPLAIGSVVDEVAGVRRSQFIQTGPTTIELRLDPEPGVDVEKLWRDLIAHLDAYLASLGLANVEIIRASELPEQSAHSGKFRQVIATRLKS
ncbi:MAG: phenylacetate--CoA ligase family protein [Acidiferrobacterales bacterium]